MTPAPISDAVAQRKRKKFVQPVILATEPRVKWTIDEAPMNPATYKLEVGPGKSWLWAHFKRFSMKDSVSRNQSKNASCNICNDEARTKPEIKWVVAYDTSTTKLYRHLETYHCNVVRDYQLDEAKKEVTSVKSTSLTDFLTVGSNN